MFSSILHAQRTTQASPMLVWCDSIVKDSPVHLFWCSRIQLMRMCSSMLSIYLVVAAGVEPAVFPIKVAVLQTGVFATGRTLPYYRPKCLTAKESIGTGTIRSHHHDQVASDVPATLIAMNPQKQSCQTTAIAAFIFSSLLIPL